jgi:hypothetical protein
MEISINDRIQKRANKIGLRPYNKGGVTIRQEIQVKVLSALLSNPSITYNYNSIIEDSERLTNKMLFSMAKEEITQELEKPA